MSQSITIEARRDGIRAALQAAEEAAKTGKGTAQAVRWKGTELVLPVSSVDLDLVLLNSHSHRISAQLQSLPQDQQDIVASDPYGAEAQGTITKLLRDTAGYERIKNALANDGQQDPGVLTTAGVLVNANTRVVALRELREKYVKVLVLPQDATSKEITDLELRLQMEQEVKQSYSFTSSLLFIEDLINSGNYTTLEVGQALRTDLTDSKVDKKKATELVELELRLLGLIREVLNASGGALNFLHFDDKRQALLEIDQDYQKVKNTKPEEAARIRDAQLTGLIVGIGYLKLRDIDATLLDSYVPGAIRENGSLAPHVDALLALAAAPDSEPVGLDLLDDDDPGPSAGTSLSGFYTLLAKSGPDDNVTLPVTDGQPVELSRRAVAAGLHGAIMTAIENKQRDSRRLDDLTAPMVHLKEATRSLDKATTAYTDVRQRGGFDHGAFTLGLQEYKRATAEFLTAASASSHGANPLARGLAAGPGAKAEGDPENAAG